MPTQGNRRFTAVLLFSMRDAKFAGHGLDFIDPSLPYGLVGLSGTWAFYHVMALYEPF